MNEYLKRGFMLGLGAAVMGKEKLDRKLKELVERNELSQEEAVSVMESFVERGNMKKDEWVARQQAQAKKMADEYGIATKEEINELRARITLLEEQLQQAEMNENPQINSDNQ